MQKKIKTKNICVKRWLKIPLISIKWSNSGIALMLFKIIPMLRLQTLEYNQKDENEWEIL